MSKVEPIDPIEPTGDGKSYLERMKRGMSNDPNANPETAKDFADRLKRYVAEGKEIRAKEEALKAERSLSVQEYKPRTSSVGSGSGDFGSGLQKMNKDLKRNYKSGGKVSSASKRADGCAQRGKTKGKIL